MFWESRPEMLFHVAAITFAVTSHVLQSGSLAKMLCLVAVFSTLSGLALAEVTTGVNFFKYDNEE